MVRKSVNEKRGNIFLRMMPVHRFIISLLLAVIVFLLMISSDLDILVKIMIAWSVFALSYIITSWIVFFWTKPGTDQGAFKTGRWQPPLCFFTYRHYFFCKFGHRIVINAFSKCKRNASNYFYTGRRLRHVVFMGNGSHYIWISLCTPLLW